VSGDPSSADHNIAWRVQQPGTRSRSAGVSPDGTRKDNIVYDITAQAGRCRVSTRAGGDIQPAARSQRPLQRPSHTEQLCSDTPVEGVSDAMDAVVKWLPCDEDCALPSGLRLRVSELASPWVRSG